MAMVGLDDNEPTAENYKRFAQLEAAGRSATYEALALDVADSPEVLEFLGTLPAGQRQPNLLFACARLLLRGVPDIGALRALVRDRSGELADVMRVRRTQTNEPARCATLLPALAMLDRPLAIIEVGASAGLCLNLAQYSYDYGDVRLRGQDPQAPTLNCEIIGGAPRLVMPDIEWAAGIDLNPLNPADPTDRAWLECLVWPDQPERSARLSAALATAVRHPVRVHEGDLLEAHPKVLEGAPDDSQIVVFHSAVLAYVDPPGRERFRSMMSESQDVIWLANEAPGVVAETAPAGYPTSPFVLTRDGETIAHTHPHGQWIDWLI